MPNTKEKLVELLARYFTIGDSYAYNLTRVKEAFAVGTVSLDDFVEFDEEVVADIADFLIANGVRLADKQATSNGWISVKERLPQEDEPLGVLCKQVQVLLSDGFVTTGWCNRAHRVWFYLPDEKTKFIGHDYEKTPVIAWQPLAQPPKGE